MIYRNRTISYLFLVYITPIILGIYVWVNHYESPERTLLLLGITLLLFSRICRVREDFDQISVFKIVFLIRIIVLLVVYTLIWKERIESGTDGFDPSRYYYLAKSLIENGLDSSRIGLAYNYNGIIFWYAILFILFGQNPIVALIANHFTTMIAALMMYDMLSDVLEGNTLSSKRRWIMLFLFTPEIMRYDVMSSREMICLFLYTGIVFLSMKIYFLNKSSLKYLMIEGLLLLGLALVRLVFVLPALFFIFIVVMKMINRRKAASIFFVTFTMLCIMLAFRWNSVLGSSVVNLLEPMSRAISNSSSLELDAWSKNSIGRLLVIDSPVKLLLYAPLRMIAYLVEPLPQVYDYIISFVQLDFVALLQEILDSGTSGIFIMCFPLLLASVMSFVSYSEEKRMYEIAFLIMLFVGACGTSLIHTRYRIASILLLYVSAAMGSEVDTNIKRLSIVLSVFLAVGFGSFYGIYKTF